MMRLGLGVLLWLLCGSATADWSLVGANQNIYSAYADRESVHRTGGESVQMLGLYDFLIQDVAVNGQPHESTIVLREYDCQLSRVRLLAFVDYAGHMGAGKVVSRVGAPEPGRWEPVVPGAIDEALWKLACAK
jgi:hypothetical protein